MGCIEILRIELRERERERERERGVPYPKRLQDPTIWRV
jgi:hypothetical protein